MEDAHHAMPRTLLECKRCHYRWFTNRSNIGYPKICPECKSPYWDTEKKTHLDRKARNRGDAPVVVVTDGMEDATKAINTPTQEAGFDI